MALITPAPEATIASFSVGDDLDALRVPYVDDVGDPMDWTGYELVSSRIYAPDGLSVVASAEFDSPYINYSKPDSAPLASPGIWSLDSVVSRNVNTYVTAPMPFVVESNEGWTSLASARAQWRDAPSTDTTLWNLLDVARSQVVAWAPAGAPVSTNLVLAQITQARNLWNAVKTDPASQGIGDEGFVIRPFPMDWTVKAIIRPPRAVPVVR